MYRSAAPGTEVTAMDPSDWGELADVPWNEWRGGTTGWETGQVVSRERPL